MRNIFLSTITALVLSAQTWAGVPLDMPLDSQNSCAIKLNGKPMRVPRFLVAQANEACPGGNIESLSMVFRFPDMTTSGWTSVASRMMEKDKGQYAVDPDVFSVLVQNLIYFGPRPKTPNEVTRPPYPDRILHNRYCARGTSNNWPCNYQGGRAPTPFIGLDSVFNAEFVRTHPDYVPPAGSGKVYASKPGAAHAALVDCDSEIGFTCQGHIYSERTGLQWDMEFPRESIVHYQDIVNKIEAILKNWI